MASPTTANWASGGSTTTVSITDGNLGSPQIGDIVFLMVETANEAVTLSTPAGFTEIATQLGVNTANTSTATRMAIYWRRIDSTPMSTVTVADNSTDHLNVGACVVSGASLDGDPFDSQWTSNASSSTSVSWPSVSGVLDDSSIMLFAVNGNSSTTESFTSISNTAAGSIVPSTSSSPSSTGYNWAVTSGAGGGIGGEILCAFKAIPSGNSSTGTSSATQANAASVSATVVVRSRNVNPYPYMRGASSVARNTPASDTLTCNYPSESVDGDLLVMSVCFRRTTGTTAASITTPSGWTLLSTEDRSTTSGVAMVVATYWRFRGSETDVSAVYSQSASTYGAVQIHAYDAATVDATTPVTVSGTSYSSTTFSSVARTCPSVTTTTDYSTLSLFSHFIKTSSGAASWAAQEKTDVYVGTTADLLVGSAIDIQQTAGATGTRNVTPNGSSNQTITATVAVQAPQLVNKNDTDTGTGTDAATASLAGTQTDAGAGTDVATGIRVSPLADTGTGTDTATASLAGTQTDAGAGTDTAAVDAQVYGVDTGTAVEGTPLITLGQSDTGTGTDIASITQAQQSDSGLGSDQASISTSGSDSSTGTEAVSLAIGGVNDVGAATESTASISLYVSDSAAGTDSESIAVGGNEFFVNDTGDGAEDASVEAVLTQADSATGAETASIENAASDASAGQDSASVSVSGAGDSGSGSESTGILADVSAADTGTATETAWVVVHVIEAGTGSESSGIVIPQSDSGTGADQAGSPDSVISQSDTATAVDEAFISVYDSDSGSATEAQARSIIGALIGVPRTFWVDAEDRTVNVPRERRTLSTDPESRLTMIGRENRTLKQYAEERTVSIES